GSGVVSHWIVEGLHVQNSPRYGIDARSSQFVTIRGNVVSNAFSTGIFTPFCYDLVVEHNTSCDNGEHGIYHNNSSDRFAIRNNHCFGNTHAGIHLNGDLSVPPPGGTPWVWDGTISDGLIENNVIHDNGTGGAGINMDGVTDTIVRNNLLYRTWNNIGIAIFHGNGAVASQRNQILNNIVVMAQGAGWCLNIASSGSVSNRVFNNIFFHPSTADGSIVIATAALQGFACDYNSLASRFSLDNDNSRTTLTVWRAAGYDTHSIVASLDDLFVDNVVNNYRLKATSPAIDRGIAQPSAPVDRDGVPRPLDGDANAVSAWDLGAYEFVHATVDTDQDGFPDRSEQIAGTDATNRASYFRITDIRSSTTESRVLTWPSAPGRQYSLSHATNLASPLTPITANIAATPPVNVQTTAVGDAVSGFFRLDVSLTP
ncbi:MAG: right-handed parallel beta-helix repeat-containing protein, partial [Verrucomicrobia bacterium]|nr:right-handed parallel beta-helix repeat-containing protein [Verrucomicrobiota bacterium]